MQYIKVLWKHDFPDDPVWHYSELDEDRWETRKVEIFAEGTKGFADQIEECGLSQLSVEPIPSL